MQENEQPHPVQPAYNSSVDASDAPDRQTLKPGRDPVNASPLARARARDTRCDDGSSLPGAGRSRQGAWPPGDGNDTLNGGGDAGE
jgi:hypothetical protein